MILYQVNSSYQLLCAITHRLTAHKDEECVLITSDELSDTLPIKKLSRFFNKSIIIEPDTSAAGKYHRHNKEYFDGLLSDNGLSIRAFSEINAMECHSDFGAYLTHNNVKHNFWEAAPGFLDSPEIPAAKIKTDNPEKAEIYEKERLYSGASESAVKRYKSINCKSDGLSTENTVYFNVFKEYMALDESLRREIFSFFVGCDSKMKVTKDATLLITEPFFSLRAMSFEEQALIYQLSVDYFFNGENIVIKPGPDDYMFYGRLFPTANVIKKNFPNELLIDFFSDTPRKIAALTSSPIKNIESSFEESFSLGNRFEREFRSTHKYKVAYEIKNAICPDYKLNSIGVNENYKSAFKVSDGKNSDKNFFVVDKLSEQETHKHKDIIEMLKNSDESSVFVFINSSADYCFYDIENKSIWKNLTPVVISKKRIRNAEFYENESTEILYVYTKNKSVADMVRGFIFSKKLRNTGLEISTRPVSERETEILLLEALLSATERTLLAYETVIKSKRKEKIPPIDKAKVEEIRYSNKDTSIEDFDETEKKLRILEGIIRSTEERLIFTTV